jgi:hypothetical protein
MTDSADKLDEAGDLSVRNNVERHRFEIALDGDFAFLQYRRGKTESVIVLAHTEVPLSWRGRGLAKLLAKSALEAAQAQGLQVIAECPFVRAYLQKHPEFKPLLSNPVGRASRETGT